MSEVRNIVITADILAEIAGRRATPLMAALAEEFTRQADDFGVDTIREWAHFLAQAAHETDRFNTLREYASGAAYEGRRDLGNTQPGDGRRFRGRGPFQYTGRGNYYRLGLRAGDPDKYINNPELLEQPKEGVWSAFVYWDDHRFNDIAQLSDSALVPYKKRGQVIYVNPVEYISRRINGGTNGLADRRKLYARAKPLINRLFEEAGIV